MLTNPGPSATGGTPAGAPRPPEALEKTENPPCHCSQPRQRPAPTAPRTCLASAFVPSSGRFMRRVDWTLDNVRTTACQRHAVHSSRSALVARIEPSISVLVEP